jgi:hypothetical protein
MTVTSGTASIASVWIDYNRDAVFQTTEHTQLWTSASSGTVNITIPSNAIGGDVAMRVRTRGTGSPNGSTDACTAFFSGTTEDYTISIIGVADATGTYTYSWTSTPAGYTATGSSVAATPTETTTYEVLATAPSGCTTTGTVTVVVNTDPIANITGGASSVCLGSPTIPATIDFDTTVGAVWTTSNPAVATVDSNGVVTPLTAGTTTIGAYIFNSLTGCTTTAANPQTVTVYAPLAITSNPASATYWIITALTQPLLHLL